MTLTVRYRFPKATRSADSGPVSPPVASEAARTGNAPAWPKSTSGATPTPAWPRPASSRNDLGFLVAFPRP